MAAEGVHRFDPDRNRIAEREPPARTWIAHRQPIGGEFEPAAEPREFEPALDHRTVQPHEHAIPTEAPHPPVEAVAQVLLHQRRLLDGARIALHLLGHPLANRRA